jgi:hypothetical protein
MDDLSKERWFQLCQLAAVENDPEKLVAIVSEVNRLLAAKEQAVGALRRGELLV